jgi:hypothetical protein
MRFFIVRHSESAYEDFIESFMLYQPVYPFIVSGAILLALVLFWNKISKKSNADSDNINLLANGHVVEYSLNPHKLFS